VEAARGFSSRLLQRLPSRWTESRLRRMVRSVSGRCGACKASNRRESFNSLVHVLVEWVSTAAAREDLFGKN